MANPPVPLDRLAGTIARMKAGTGIIDNSKVAPVPATMSQQTAMARKMGDATAQPGEDIAAKRAKEAADAAALQKRSGMSDAEMDKAFIPESRMKKLSEVVKKVRKDHLQEQNVNEVLSGSNMSQLKVPSDRQGAINGGSRPLAQRTRSRYVYGEENETVKTETKKKSSKELEQAAKDGVEVNPQIDDLKQE